MAEIIVPRFACFFSCKSPKILILQKILLVRLNWDCRDFGFSLREVEESKM